MLLIGVADCHYVDDSVLKESPGGLLTNYHAYKRIRYEPMQTFLTTPVKVSGDSLGDEFKALGSLRHRL